MIPLSVPEFKGNEWKYVKDCLDTGWVSSAGKYVDSFERSVAQFTGAQYAVATMNGTAALHIALLLLDVKPGDLVVIPNITFVATANAIRYCGADPLLIDADPETWQMDLDLLESFFEKKTKITFNGERVHIESGRTIRVVMPVHVQGNIFDMNRFRALSEKFGFPFVEDAAEALGSRYLGKSAGRFGKLGCFSFNGNKIISCGGGGMIITDDEKLAKRAKHLSTTAKTDPMEYYHDEVGYNYRLVNVLAGIGLAQMEQLDERVKSKRRIAATYRSELEGVGDINFQKVLDEVEANEWLFTIQTAYQKSLLRYLNEEGIISRPFWMPMNLLPMFKGSFYESKNQNCNKIYQTCMALPCSSNLTESDQDQVIQKIKGFFENVSFLQATS